MAINSEQKEQNGPSFQQNNFGISSQPYYILMHNDGTTLLTRPVAYTPEVAKYEAFLNCGLQAFKDIKKIIFD